jgi:DNA segregation ATPase FtsK/SpoIIIE, S-DNA-T family
MTIELSVADVRGALLRSARGDVAGSGESATLLLGKLFHEVFADLVSDDPHKSGLRVITEAPQDGEQRVQALLEHSWRQLIAPRLRRHAASLQTSSDRVLVLWRANQNLARWLVAVVTELVGQSAQPRESWQHLTESLRSEVPLSCELAEHGWRESVRLVGIADSILRVPGKPYYCALELKLGRCAPVVDLGQAALYHLLLTRSMGTVSKSALALLRFSPELDERLVDNDALGNVEKTLLLLIADLAGVSGESSVKGASGTGNATTGQKRPPKQKPDKNARSGGSTSGTSKPQAKHVPSSEGAVTTASASVRGPAHVGSPPEPVHVEAPAPADAYAELTTKLVRAYKEQGVGIEVREPPVAGPRFLRFSLRLASGMKIDALRRRTAEVQHRLELTREPMITQEAGRLFIDVERPDPQTVPFSSIVSQLPAVESLTGSARLPIGVDAAGKLHWADLASAGRSHVLAAGTTGSGKSEWLRMIIAGLIASNTPDTLRFVTLDPKLAAFNDLERSAFLWTKDAWWIPGNDRPASEVFEDLIEEMDRRYQLTRQTGTDNLRDHVLKTGKPLPRIVCVCDEYFALVSQSKEEGRAIEEAVAKLGAKARAAGIHLVLATQQPSRKIINGNIQSNLPCRVALMLQSHIESTMILNTSGAERLTGSGDLLYRDFGDPIRLQAPYLPPAERAQWLQR